MGLCERFCQSDPTFNTGNYGHPDSSLRNSIVLQYHVLVDIWHRLGLLVQRFASQLSECVSLRQSPSPLFRLVPQHWSEAVQCPTEAHYASPFATTGGNVAQRLASKLSK